MLFDIIQKLCFWLVSKCVIGENARKLKTDTHDSVHLVGSAGREPLSLVHHQREVATDSR